MIIVLKKQSQDDGSVRWNLFHYYDISGDPVLDNGGAVLATQAGDQLSAEAQTYLSSVQQNAIQSGAAGYITRPFEQTPGESVPEFVARMRGAYTALAADWLAKQKAVYENMGQQVSV